jgi:phosphate transport system substrate-binding protein
MIRYPYFLSLFLVLTSTVPGSAWAGESKGAGSTFVAPVMDKWSLAYFAETGNRIVYQSVGSGLGIKAIKNAEVDFGASDKPLDPTELTKAGLIQFPIVIGGVVPVVNIEGVKPSEMKFTGQLLADIYLGKVKNWNDPAIRQINPTLPLPNSAITVVHRLDASGTTFNWCNYLSKVSAAWKNRVGEGTTVDWPLGLGGKGNDGVASLVAMIPGSIGYLEYAYALQKFDRISFGIIENSAGNFVSPATKNFQAAVAGANWDDAADFFLVLTDAPGPEAYPITATTFVLMPRHPKSPTRAAGAIDFMKWALEKGATDAETLHYVSLPPALIRKIENYWNSNRVGATSSAAKAE